MAKIEFPGMEEYQKRFQQLSLKMRSDVVGGAIYDAAGIVADEIQTGVSSIPTMSHFTYAAEGETVSGLLEPQKAALHSALGISHMRDDTGYLSVKVGWDGYNNIRTVRWPKGQPNQMIARSLERGTSWLKSFPFVKRSVAASKARAIQAMQDRIDRACEEIMK